MYYPVFGMVHIKGFSASEISLNVSKPLETVAYEVVAAFYFAILLIIYHMSNAT